MPIDLHHNNNHTNALATIGEPILDTNAEQLRFGTMGQPSDRFPFFQLPREVRDMIFVEFFQSLSVNAFYGCLINRGIRKPKSASICNILRVSKQFHNEAKPYFLSETIFYATPDCRATNFPTGIDQMHKIPRIILTEGCGHDEFFNGRLLAEFMMHLASRRRQKFQSITVDWCLRTCERINKDDIRELISGGHEHTQVLLLKAKPAYSSSCGRICVIRIEPRMEIRITGAFMDDVENVAVGLCVAADFEASIICILKKTFAKPATKVMTVGEVRKLVSRGVFGA